MVNLVTFRRFPRKAIPATALTVALPLLATAWLIGNGPEDSPPPPASPVAVDTGPAPSQTRPSVADRGPTQTKFEVRPLGAEVTQVESKAVALARARPVQERYVALERLERSGSSETVAVVEELVREARDDPKERALAVNALGILARVAGGEEALRRCAKTAPSESLRSVARTLLAHAGNRPRTPD